MKFKDTVIPGELRVVAVLIIAISFVLLVLTLLGVLK